MTYPFLAFPDPSKGASAPRIPRPASSLVFKRAKHPEFADFDVNCLIKDESSGIDHAWVTVPSIEAKII